MNIEFVACVYNIFLRRDQLRAVELSFKGQRWSPEELGALRQVAAGDLVAFALASGECDDIRSLLRKKNLNLPLKRSMEMMQQTQRNVRGSDEERQALIYKFRAMRIWNGCSTFFFILNPHDIRSPLTLTFINEQHFHV